MLLILHYLFLTTLILFLSSPALNMPPMWTILVLGWLTLLLKLTSISSHTLLVLLVLEMFMLLFLFFLLILKNNMFSNSNFVLTFFTLAVCEAGLGLSLLISIARKFGAQTLNIFSAFKLT